MKITTQDLQTLLLLDKYGCSISFNQLALALEDFEGQEHFTSHGVFESITDFCIKTLQKITPSTGTPNSEMSDKCKGLIQLLFEVEKAIA